MRSVILAGLIVSIFAVPLAGPMPRAAAQAQSPDVSASPDLRQLPGDLSIEKKRRDAVVHPLPSSGVVEQDIDQATRAERDRRDAEAAREAVNPPWHRPDLDYNVHSGIQQRNLERLRR